MPSNRFANSILSNAEHIYWLADNADRDYKRIQRSTLARSLPETGHISLPQVLGVLRKELIPCN